MSQHQISRPPVPRPRPARPRPVRRRRSGPGVVASQGSPAIPARPLVRAGDEDLGATTVEYAMVVLAAAAFGGVMAAVLSSGQVRELLTAIIERALGV